MLPPVSRDVLPDTAPSKGRSELRAILMLAFALRLIPFFLALPSPERFYTLDARGYMALAFDLRGGYLEPGSAQWPIGFMRTPGYPLFAGAVLSLSGGSIAALILAQMGLSLLAIVLAYRICDSLFGRKAARIAALALALDPATIVYTNLLQPESLFIVVLLGCLLLWMKALRDLDLPSALAAGALAGMATLTRPIGVLLALPLLAIALCVEGGARRKAALFIAASLSSSLFVGGWMARNAAYTGVPFLSSIEGLNFLYYRAAGAIAMDEDRDMEGVRQDLQKEMDRRVGSNPNPGVVSREQSQFGMQVLKEHPWGALRSAADGVFHLAAGTGLTALSGLRGDPEPERVLGFVEQTLQFLFAALLAALYAFALLGLWRLARARDFTSLSITLSFILYFVVMSAGPEATTRFRVPIAPFLAILAGAGTSRTSLGESRPAETT